jgi:hypothetical protein
MTNKLVKCPHCGYKYPTDVEKFVDDGKTSVVRLGFSDLKNKFQATACKSLFIDLKCPNCKKEFEYEVKI